MPFKSSTVKTRRQYSIGEVLAALKNDASLPAQLRVHNVFGIKKIRVTVTKKQYVSITVSKSKIKVSEHAKISLWLVILDIIVNIVTFELLDVDWRNRKKNIEDVFDAVTDVVQRHFGEGYPPLEDDQQ